MVRNVSPIYEHKLTWALVIVDKPFTMTSEEADKVIKISEDKGLILTCFQNRRWVSLFVHDKGDVFRNAHTDRMPTSKHSATS
jgi:hypothetical protein